MMVEPAKERKRVAVIVYKAGHARGECEVVGCDYTCYADIEGVSGAIEACRKQLQGHLNAHKQFTPGEYFFDVVEEGQPHVT